MIAVDLEKTRMKTQAMGQRARTRIAGGTQLLSKRPEMFAPGQWPGYYSKAKGAETWDLDGNKYVDMSIFGVGACVLGFADPDVDAAVHAAIDAGSMATLNCPEEIELADLLCEIHPWADMVRYGRSGGEAMGIAVRIARAHTGRDKVAFCGYHGWHDWYLAANLSQGDTLDGHLLPGLDPAGVPRGLAGTALPFRYNQLDELEAIAANNPDQLAAIVMEPVRSRDPEPGFLEGVREIANRIGAVMIFDEVTSGLRMNSGGIHLRYGVSPDIAVFAKAMGNGYPIAAVIGIGSVMQAAQTTFISSTSWTERIGPVAALATIRKHRELDVASHLIATGERIQSGWQIAADGAGLKIHVSGIPPLSHVGFEYPNGQAIGTLFTQLMLERGFLAGKAFYASYAHQDVHIESYLEAVRDVFAILAAAVERNEVEKQLLGPVAHSGFHRLT
jgi:glutamate-1-semialdehyde 2,1-aminomutase